MEKRNYDTILADYDLPAILWRLNDACGSDRALTLQETQEIRQLVERLHKEQRKPIKHAHVCLVTLWHDGKTVEILRRGKGPSAQRRYQIRPRLYRALSRLCHEMCAFYGPYCLDRDRTTYRVREYVPQG